YRTDQPYRQDRTQRGRLPFFELPEKKIILPGKASPVYKSIVSRCHRRSWDAFPAAGLATEGPGRTARPHHPSKPCGSTGQGQKKVPAEISGPISRCLSVRQQGTGKPMGQPRHHRQPGKDTRGNGGFLFVPTRRQIAGQEPHRHGRRSAISVGGTTRPEQRSVDRSGGF